MYLLWGIGTTVQQYLCENLGSQQSGDGDVPSLRHSRCREASKSYDDRHLAARIGLANPATCYFHFPD